MSRIDNVTAYNRAIELLKRAGFVLHHVSSQTETCYFVHPSRAPLLLRVSMHKSKGSPMGLNDVIARLSFTLKDTRYLSERTVINRVKFAIGEYFLGTPKPSQYKGKRGTWEARATPPADRPCA